MAVYLRLFISDNLSPTIDLWHFIFYNLSLTIYPRQFIPGQFISDILSLIVYPRTIFLETVYLQAIYPKSIYLRQFISDNLFLTIYPRTIYP
jgi:hypothetical protein